MPVRSRTGTQAVELLPQTSSADTLAPVATQSSKGTSSKPYIDAYGNEFKIPDYTIKDIYSAIPQHCFERSPVTGFMYITRDLLLLAGTFYIFNTYVTPELVPSYPARVALWGLYTFIQGLFGTGIWVIAHECGHQAFSPSKVLNDTVGFVLHSALLVPYFSWKISHGKHHKSTGHIERDMVHVPKTKEVFAQRVGTKVDELLHLAEEAPIVTLGKLIGKQMFGWWIYLITNRTGHNSHERQREGRGKGKRNGLGGGVNHFDPNSPLYEAKDAKWILLSDLGILIMGSVLTLLSMKYGWKNMAVWYFLPYMWVNHWLVAITYLQHTDPSVPYYTQSSWSFVRGAAATIDRDFGFIGRELFHGIIETHVLHHYISTIPFYHAEEASVAIRKVMGSHYRSDVKGGPWGFMVALYKCMRRCEWVEGDELLFYKNRNKIHGQAK